MRFNAPGLRGAAARSETTHAVEFEASVGEGLRMHIGPAHRCTAFFLKTEIGKLGSTIRNSGSLSRVKELIRSSKRSRATDTIPHC